MSRAVQGDLFQTCRERLGVAARLGVFAVLFDVNGERLSEVGLNESERFPMASIVKVPLAMLVASEIANGSLSLREEIKIRSLTASPGPIGNPLDRFYFLPFDTVRTHTVDQLTGFILHNSDNTATDAVLHRLGGTPSLRKFLIHELHLDGICVQRTMDELMTYYYGLRRDDVPNSSHRGISQLIGSIIGNIRRMASPYVCQWNREEHLIYSAEETCTPRAIADVLTRVTMNPKFALVYSHLQRCATNKRRIIEGLMQHRPIIRHFGHKTGSLGGIANDVGIVHFNNGFFAVLAVLTCLSTASIRVRDQQDRKSVV